MKPLEITFIGKGEVKGFIFTQIKKSEKAYIYKVETEVSKHYEVFKHKENTQFNCISYPSSKGFGVGCNIPFLFGQLKYITEFGNLLSPFLFSISPSFGCELLTVPALFTVQ